MGRVGRDKYRGSGCARMTRLSGRNCGKRLALLLSPDVTFITYTRLRSRYDLGLLGKKLAQCGGCHAGKWQRSGPRTIRTTEKRFEQFSWRRRRFRVALRGARPSETFGFQQHTVAVWRSFVS